MSIKIEAIRNDIIKMASLAEKAIEYCNDKDIEKKELMEVEDEINFYHKKVDDDCFKFIALHNPVARDLREVLAVMKINSDLERIGDQAVNIKRTYFYLKNFHPLLSTLKEETQHMVKNAIDAYVHINTMLSIDVIKNDETINDLHRTTIKNYFKLMKESNIDFDEAYNVIQISKNFERIGDHAKNIAEDVIFMDKGKDIRHTNQHEFFEKEKKV